MFVDGKECGRELTEVDREAKKIARYDLGIYECSLGHRSYFLLEPKSKATDPSAMSREEQAQALVGQPVRIKRPSIRKK